MLKALFSLWRLRGFFLWVGIPWMDGVGRKWNKLGGEYSNRLGPIGCVSGYAQIFG